MVAACQQLGIDPDASQLIRIGENALFRLNAESVIVRIGRSINESKKEVAVSVWLAENGISGTELAYPEVDILIIDSFPVTFWKLIDESPVKPTASELGCIIRRLHTLPQPALFTLPHFTAMPKIDGRLAKLRDKFNLADIEFIYDRKTKIEKQLGQIDSALGWGPIHGDAHIGNLMRDASGTIRLIDYGDFCIGPREWDICVLAVSYKVGTIPQSTYREFADAYGFDALTWSGFPIIQAARKLNMTTWLMQLVGHSPKVDAEIAKRLADLRNGCSRSWEAF